MRVRLAVMVRPGLQLDAERELRRLLVESFEAEKVPLTGSLPVPVVTGAGGPAAAQPTPPGRPADTTPPKGPGPAR